MSRILIGRDTTQCLGPEFNMIFLRMVMLNRYFVSRILMVAMVLNFVSCRTAGDAPTSGTLKNSEPGATLLHKAGIHEQIIALAVSPVDPYRVVIVNRKREIKSVDLKNGKIIWSMMSGFVNELLQVRVSADGKMVAFSGARDMRTHLGLIDAAKGTLISRDIGDAESEDEAGGTTVFYGWHLVNNPVVEFSPSQRAYVVQKSYFSKQNQTIIKFIDFERKKDIHVWVYDNSAEFGPGGSYFPAFKFSSDGNRILPLHQNLWARVGSGKSPRL